MPRGGPIDGQKRTESLPASQPLRAWNVAQSWPPATADAEDTGGQLSSLSLGIIAAGVPVDRDAADTMIEQVAVWRDLLDRPAADGVVKMAAGHRSGLRARRLSFGQPQLTPPGTARPRSVSQPCSPRDAAISQLSQAFLTGMPAMSA